MLSYKFICIAADHGGDEIIKTETNKKRGGDGL